MTESNLQRGRRNRIGVASGVLLAGLMGAVAYADVADTWEARALFLQHRIDDAAPLKLAQFPHTHNSYNNNKDSRDQSRGYNHAMSLRDQLSYGIRSLTFDVIEDGGKKLCHGACLATDMSFKEGLDKILNFLNEPGMSTEVIHLRLAINKPKTNSGDWMRELRQALVDKVGGRIYTPKDAMGNDASCISFSSLVGTLTKAKIRAAKKNLIITSDEACQNDGVAHLDDWVFKGDFNPTINLKKPGKGPAFSAYPACTFDGKDPKDWLSNFVRAYESRLEDDHLDLEINDVRKLVGCGINAVAPAPMQPDYNPHRGQVWSWAEGYPVAVTGPTMAYVAMDDKSGELRILNTTAATASVKRQVACRNSLPDPNVGAYITWKVTPNQVSFAEASAACLAVNSIIPKRYQFAVPHNGYDMNLLRSAMNDSGVSSSAGVWVNYQNPTGTSAKTSWAAVSYYEYPK